MAVESAVPPKVELTISDRVLLLMARNEWMSRLIAVDPQRRMREIYMSLAESRVRMLESQARMIGSKVERAILRAHRRLNDSAPDHRPTPIEGFGTPRPQVVASV